MNISYIFRKGESEIRLDDPSQLDIDKMSVGGYVMVNVVDWTGVSKCKGE